MPWNEFYQRLPIIQEHLKTLDPKLDFLFTNIKVEFHNSIKKPYQSIIGTLIGQKIRYTVAKQIRGKLWSYYGTNFSPGSLDPNILMKFGIDSRFLNIISELDIYIRQKNLDLRKESDLLQISNISGIGSWTVNVALLSSGMRWDIFPINDVFLQIRIQRLYNLDHRPTEMEMKIISDKWGIYKGIVCWYLWRWF